MEGLKSFAALLGRVLISPIFLLSGVMKIMNWTPTAANMASEGMVAVEFFLAMAIAFELAGGLSVLLGYRARLGALALVVFLIPTTYIFHDFWTYQGASMENQMQHFMKNVTILGGLLILAAFGSGRYSLDGLLARSRLRGARSAAEQRTADQAGPLARQQTMTGV